MRVLLVAMNCPKGEISANLAAHRAHLEAAAQDGCEIAVFPEMSLTGYIDPVRQPEAILGLSSVEVEELARYTGETGVAALFGIVENSGTGRKPFITQVFAQDGKVAGAYRKRQIHSDEIERFMGGSESPVFQNSPHMFGATVCADIDVNVPFDDVAVAGAKVIFHCSAPGLYGRRFSEDEWQQGYEWWKGDRHTKLPPHAQRNGVWIASVAQAGQTVDEDFPGGACLISPDGAVLELSTDWRPGSFVADIPLDHPHA